MQTVLISGGLVLLGTIVTVLGSKAVAKLSARAQLKTAEIEEDKVRAQAYTEARETYREMVADLRKEIGGVRTAQTEDRESHRRELTAQDERHRKQIADLREERREHDALLNTRLDELETQRDRDRERIQALESRNQGLVTYVRQLIRLLRDHEIVPPPAPTGFTFD